MAQSGATGRESLCRARARATPLLALGLCAALLSAPPALARSRKPHVRLGPRVSVTLTRASLSAALKRMPSLRFSSARTYARTLTVNPSAGYQRMIGFGGAMTDSSAWLLYSQLTPRARVNAMRALFSTGPGGIGLNFVRVPIGASDFTANGEPYTYDDLPAGQTDPKLAEFSIAHDEAYIIPALRQMLGLDPKVYLLATEWSPPAWMKTNDSTGNVGYRGTPLPDDYASLALYFIKFIQAYAQQGIPIWGVTPQNEPNSPAPYPAATFTADGEAQFINQDLAPAFAATGLHTLIFGTDDTQLPFAEQLMQSPAAQALSGMAWHCYLGQQVIRQFHDQYPGLANLLSECSPGIIPYGAAEVAIDGARNWASAIDLWNLALDPSGGPVQAPDAGCPNCTGLLTVSESRHAFTYNANYYELGQFSKFVKPGAVRVGTPRWVSDYTATGPQGHPTFGVTHGLDNVAFRNPDGSYVLICHQNAASAVTFGVQAQGLRFRYRLPGRATVTFSWREPS